jgi:hypothetical protein
MRRAPKRDDPGINGSGQLLPQTFDDAIGLGDLQRQHLDVLRERVGGRPQFGQLGTAHGAQFCSRARMRALRALGDDRRWPGDRQCPSQDPFEI